MISWVGPVLANKFFATDKSSYKVVMHVIFCLSAGLILEK